MHKFYRKEKEATNRIICFFLRKEKRKDTVLIFFSLILKME